MYDGARHDMTRVAELYLDGLRHDAAVRRSAGPRRRSRPEIRSRLGHGLVRLGHRLAASSARVPATR